MNQSQNEQDNIRDIVETLSPIEKKIIPFINLNNFDDIIKKSGLDRVSVLRAMEFLNSKSIIDLKIDKKKVIELGTNGIYYLKKGLPERRLLSVVEKKIFEINEASKDAKLSANEFKVAIGVLKKMGLIDIKSGKIIFIGTKEEVVKKTPEEKFLEELPMYYDKLKDEDKVTFEKLRERKDIIEVKEEQIVSFSLTKLGKQIIEYDLDSVKDLLEEITSEMIKYGSWKGKKFRRYDIKSKVPKIYGGRRHFISYEIDYSRKIWLEMGFEEMSGNFIQSSFWVFDALFTPQDHPARELQDTFFLDANLDLPNNKLVRDVKMAHEKGISGSKGWRYSWSDMEAKKAVLRTHTTCLSAKTLSGLRDIKDKKGKFFAIGKCFRNETIDQGHLFEFNQTEGIVIDINASFSHLLGYLQAFLNKMGFDRVRFRPHFFPYTEPSVEADVFDIKNNKWVEVLGAGIFRPEVVVPLLGEFIPVLAWGMGFDRMVMKNYEINDIRDLYKNDISYLRNFKIKTK
ncbi:MAG: phenylalanine--tRNA ligase subunit alpha [Candidatus Pacearchaeota archaeon]